MHVSTHCHWVISQSPSSKHFLLLFSHISSLHRTECSGAHLCLCGKLRWEDHLSILAQNEPGWHRVTDSISNCSAHTHSYELADTPHWVVRETKAICLSSCDRYLVKSKILIHSLWVWCSFILYLLRSQILERQVLNRLFYLSGRVLA